MNTDAQPRFSVIICSINAWKFAQVSQCYARLLASWPHEIIGIHDASSIAEGYNRGIARSRGDILIFSHDDVMIIDPDFAAKISERLQTWTILGFTGTSRLINAIWFGAGLSHQHGVVAHPYKTHFKLSVYGVSGWPVIGGIQAIDGQCMITTHEAAQAIGFDAATFDGFHLYDLDFSFAAYHAGYELGVCCDIPFFHESVGNYDRQHRKYAKRFVAKYAELKDAPPEHIVKIPKGRAALFSDEQAILAAWRPDVLKRTDIAMRQEFAESMSTPFAQ
ncbi:MAG: glycosyltransferase family protein [Zoogloeaceae bacterium]|jgi:glycosyltransferase involved in cell wall biosynthesis|nr:glycosyltransferase family protein [Zoogloeaceae bacterium]